MKLLAEKEEIIRKFERDVLLEADGKRLKAFFTEKTDAEKALYRGSLDVNGNRHGQGICYFQNGDVYFGEWKNDVFNGKGTYIFSSGERYEGDLLKGLKDGKGKAKKPDFLKIKKSGVYYYKNGNTYTGTWVNDKKEGEVTQRNSDLSLMKFLLRVFFYFLFRAHLHTAMETNIQANGSKAIDREKAS
jgi:hypothetical protein